MICEWSNRVLTECFGIAYALQEPHPTQDLIALYGLSTLATSVARIDPMTREKINKMRRSYEGQVKTLGLAGRNKAVKHEANSKSMGLSELVAWPDEEWQNQKVAGKRLNTGFSGNFVARMEKVMKMEQNSMPKSGEWEVTLGQEKLKAPVAMAENKGKQSAVGHTKTSKVNGHIRSKVNNAAAIDAGRAQRATGKRRRYDEHSFEGYGEGYVDDEAEAVAMDHDGYSSGTGGRKDSLSKKKRKKVHNRMPLTCENPTNDNSIRTTTPSLHRA